jgi:threonine/homoserine/homoserine lactone efflux protein
MNFLASGFLLGFLIAAPVGPIGVLCIRRTLANGRLIGFLSGLGAATADTLYGAVAIFGLTVAQGLLIGSGPWLRLIGGLMLLYLGVRTFVSRSAPTIGKTEVSGAGLLGAYLSTVLLTITNPATIITFAVLVAGLGFINLGGTFATESLLVLGIFMGSAGWWLALSWVVGYLREKITAAQLVWVNRIAGVILSGFGVVVLVSLVL